MQIFDLFSIINPDKQQTNSMQGGIICFAEDALENRKMKWQGRAILLPGIPLWLIMLGSIMFITAFLMFIIVGTYSRRVNVSGEVTTGQELSIYIQVYRDLLSGSLFMKGS
uniref:Colicin V secretion protein CvaA n=1 Tax=Escherichia coli TaxID=562 RepID=A0A811AQ45_ECOLX|nr:hypothetical protein [Escherichia coli]